MENTTNKISIEKVTMFVSVAGLFMSLILSEINRRANIELEEKKIESTLFLQAIQVNNKKTTLENLKFLLKMGAISKDRERVIESLSDSFYIDKKSQVFTKSDTVWFFDFQIMNNQKDKALYYQYIRGANVQIVSSDTMNNFKLSQYTDNYGKAEFYYPKVYGNKFTTVTVIKNGYKNKTFELRLPDDKIGGKYIETIIMEPE